MPDDRIMRAFVKKQRNHPDIDSIFRNFQEREFAQDLYVILESIRSREFLVSELPALMRKAEELEKSIFEERPHPESLSGMTAVAEGLFQYYLCAETKGSMPARGKDDISEIEGAKAGEEPDFHIGTLIRHLPRWMLHRRQV